MAAHHGAGRALSMGCVLSLALLWAHATFASPVYEVRSEHGSFLLGGTIHMLRPRDFPPPEVFERAYEAAAVVILEVDPADLQLPKVQRLLGERAFQEPGRSLEDALRPDTWQRLAALGDELGIPPAMLARMRPGFAGLTLAQAMLARIGVTEIGVDGYYYLRARADGRPLKALESAGEQMTLLLELGRDDPDRFLDVGLDEPEQVAATLDAAISEWRKGDFEALHARLVEPVRTGDPETHRSLFSVRNATWMARLESFAGTSELELVLVGAGHLGGEEGLLEALRTQGYEVRPWP